MARARGEAETPAPVALIDGHSLTYRAFFALPDDMATASGQVTNAVFGFTSMLVNVMRELQPSGVLVAFDRSEPTFRHESEPEYKAQRESSPDVLRQQVGLVREVLTALGIPTVDAAGWEADDLIATAATALAARRQPVVIVTGDRDSYQLVSDPMIRVMYNKRGVSDYALYDEAGIVERTGVHPERYPEYAALRGDPSDNLPGVPGVGEKTAAKLINTYGGLDGIFENLEELSPKLRASLAENEGRARKNLELMVLRRDAPLEGIDLGALRPRPRPDEVRRLFDFLEFRGLIRRVAEVLDIGGDGDDDDSVTHLVAEVAVVESAAAARTALAASDVIDLAAAWEGEPGRSPLLGVAVVTDADSADVMWLPRATVVDIGATWSELSSIRGHDVKAIMRSFFDLGLDLGGPDGLALDTAIAAYLIDPGDGVYSIDALVSTHTRFRLVAGQASDGRLDLDGTALDVAATTAATALAVHHLVEPLTGELERLGMFELYRRIENPLVRVLARMEHIGIGVDVATLEGINQRLTEEVAALGARLREVSGREDLNPNSPVQLRELLYEQRGLTPIKKTKTGFSTDAATLERLRDQWPEFIDPLLRHREVDKLRGTYAEGLLHEVAADGRIHATFNQTVARTGRLSSDRPNLHNIPVRSDEGRRFRTAFVPGPGFEFLIADYNQIELRCIAHLAEDPGLIEAFSTGVDIHNATAARVFDVAPGSVTVDQRSQAKMVSYGLAYGMEAYGLGQRLNIPTDEAAAILDAYFEAFPSVRRYMDETVAQARTRGYTETLFGRRRPIPELSSSNFRLRQAGERQAMNAGIQGLAADLFKVALIDIDHALESGGHRSRLILQVHDEVVVEVDPDEHDVVGQLVVESMRSAADLRVPLEVNIAWGGSWAAAK